jgi:hypothetical protein
MFFRDQLERIEIVKSVEVSGLEVGRLRWKAVDVLTATLTLVAEQILYFRTIGGKSGQ